MTRTEDISLTDILEDAFGRFGPRKVAVTALKSALFRKKPKPQDTASLGDHLRQDIGLGPAEPSNTHWRYLP